MHVCGCVHEKAGSRVSCPPSLLPFPRQRLILLPLPPELGLQTGAACDMAAGLRLKVTMVLLMTHISSFLF